MDVYMKHMPQVLLNDIAPTVPGWLVVLWSQHHWEPSSDKHYQLRAQGYQHLPEQLLADALQTR